MSVFRLKRNGEYFTMSSYHLRDTRLSWKAMGLLSFMLSNTDSFEYSVEGLARCAKDKVCSVSSALKELKQYGYLKVYAVRDEKGHIKDWNYDVYEKPQDSQNQDSENQDVENKGQSNINISNIKGKNSSSTHTISLHSSPTLTSSPTTPTSTMGTTTPQPPEVDCGFGREKKELDLSFIADFRFRGMMRRWFDFHKELRKPYTQMGAEQCYKKLLEMSKQDPSIAQQIIDQSIGNNWQGLFPLKSTPNGNYNTTSTAGSNWTTEYRRAFERRAGIIK